MKKLLYVLLFAFATTMSITACTDESVKPSTGEAPSGGASDPIKR